MAYDPGALEAALSAAVGDDQGLIAELRGVFLDRACEHVRAMAEATSPADWRSAAMRLHSLAASFGATRVIEVAHAAVRADAPDAELLQKVERAIWALTA